MCARRTTFRRHLIWGGFPVPFDYIQPRLRNEYSDRMALIDVTADYLGEIAPVFGAVGIQIVGSHNNHLPDTIRLLVRGDALPEVCGVGALKLIRLSFIKEMLLQAVDSALDLDQIGERLKDIGPALKTLFEYRSQMRQQ